MAANVYLKTTGSSQHVRGQNDSGGDMSQYDFEVVGPFAAIADEDVDDGETGGFDVSEGAIVKTDELHTGEDTFGTAWQAVYWNSTELNFSDIETDDYYLVGYLTSTKDGNGFIEFWKLMYAELVAT